MVSDEHMQLVPHYYRLDFGFSCCSACSPEGVEAHLHRLDTGLFVPGFGGVIDEFVQHAGNLECVFGVLRDYQGE
jgi:hypothetical protein